MQTSGEFEAKLLSFEKATMVYDVALIRHEYFEGH